MVGATLARAADEGARVGLVLLAVERTGSAAFGGALVAALLMPQVVAAPIVGRVIDVSARGPRAVGWLVVGFSVCLLLGPTLVGHLTGVVAVLVLAVGGTMAPAATGGLSSLLGGLVGPRRQARAYGMDSAVYSVCGAAGPAAVGLLATALGAMPAVTAIAAAGLVGGLVLLGLSQVHRRTPVADHTAEVDGPRWAGVAAVLRDRQLAAVTAASGLGQVGLGALSVVVAVLGARQESPAVAALLLAALPFGALLGSLGWMRSPAAPGHAPVAVVRGQVAVGIVVAVAAVSGQPVVVALLLAGAGAALGRSTGALFLTRDHRSPSGAVAEVFAVGAGLKLACGAAGAVGAGLAADHDVRLVLLGCGAVPIVAGLVGGLLLRGHRRYEQRPADA